MKHYRFIVLVIVMSLTFAVPAYAYLDPGSGSIILQGIIAAIAGGLAAAKLYWSKLKNFYRRHIGKTGSGKAVIEVKEVSEKDNNDQPKT